MMKKTQKEMISRSMAASHGAAESARAFLAPTSSMTIIITTTMTTTELGAIGA